ncbi:hypothetical protein R1sor_009726 [Riccia sorocarpa]|uniref:WRC domain-containing protein n=1 Tax=Riccia sorocarpa TaxID=122646 RepID=A0ABD3HZG3_9MARC
MNRCVLRSYARRDSFLVSGDDIFSHVDGKKNLICSAGSGRPTSKRVGKAQVESGRSLGVAEVESYQLLTGCENSHQRSGETEPAYGQVASSEGAVVSRGVADNVDELSLQEENAGARCTRVDGRSWQCRRTSLPGFALCEHHHLQLSNQSRRQRSFQRAFNRSSRKRFRKRENRTDVKVDRPKDKRISPMNSGHRKARSLNALVQSCVAS